jgi:hypothetical protein
MRRLEDLEIVRVLTVCDLISRIRPDCPLALLPSWGRDQAYRDAWRQALMAHSALLAELGEILNQSN